jgi:hypothetical protein
MRNFDASDHLSNPLRNHIESSSANSFTTSFKAVFMASFADMMDFLDDFLVAGLWCRMMVQVMPKMATPTIYGAENVFPEMHKLMHQLHRCIVDLWMKKQGTRCRV